MSGPKKTTADGCKNVNALDGCDGTEILVVTFDGSVKLSTITFGKFDGTDTYDLFYGTGDSATKVNPPKGDLTINPFEFGETVIIDWFAVKADKGEAVDFRLASADVSAVPLPAPALMLLAGIGGLGALRRRKTR